MTNDSKYGSRKFILAVSGLAISSFLVWFGKISGGEYVAMTSILGGAFMVTNTIANTRGSANSAVEEN